MKRGYRVSMTLGIIGFILICYIFLNPSQYPNTWIYFSLCGLVGIIVSYSFIIVTQYYTDSKYRPV